MFNCKAVLTPCGPETEYDETKREASGLLKGCEATAYRGVAASLHRMALDLEDVHRRLSDESLQL